MSLWGTSADVTTNKPKFCPADANSPYDRTEVFASQADIALNSGTLSDTTVGGTTTAALRVLTALSAQTQTTTAA